MCTPFVRFYEQDFLIKWGELVEVLLRTCLKQESGMWKISPKKSS